MQHDTRDSNIIPFGLPESGSIVETKNTVNEVLEFILEKPVPIRDVFRLGKPPKPSSSEGFPLPCSVLVKLSTPWDCKLILPRKRNLRGKIPRLFLREDVTPDHKLRSRKSGTSSSAARKSNVAFSSYLVTGESSSLSLPLSTASQVTELSGPPSLLDSSHALSPVTSSCSSSPATSQPSSSSSHTIVQGQVDIYSLMAPLQCGVFNCRGWNSGLLTLQHNYYH